MYIQGIHDTIKINYLTTNKGVTECRSFNLCFSLLIYNDPEIRKLNLQLVWSQILKLKISILVLQIIE